MPLEQYYSGDSALNDFVDVHRREMKATATPSSLIDNLSGQEDLATVIASLVPDPEAWIHRPVPALDGLSPLECLDTSSGVTRLRVCLMRFPV